MKHWHLTSTTYGTWLPGDERGFVGTVKDYRPEDQVKKQQGIRVRHNLQQTDYDRDAAGLCHSAKVLLKCDPIFFNQAQAEATLAQFQETCNYRHWPLLVASIMPNHFHTVVAAPDEVESEDILGDLKAYASRILNRKWASRHQAPGGRNQAQNDRRIMRPRSEMR